MHELSIALSIIEVASAAVERTMTRHVVSVHVRIGALTAVSSNSLAFHFSEASRNTLLAEARLVITWLPVVVHCPACNSDTELHDDLRLICARCGEPTGEVIRGRELEVESIEVT